MSQCQPTLITSNDINSEQFTNVPQTQRPVIVQPIGNINLVTKIIARNSFNKRFNTRIELVAQSRNNNVTENSGIIDPGKINFVNLNLRSSTVAPARPPPKLKEAPIYKSKKNLSCLSQPPSPSLNQNPAILELDFKTIEGLDEYLSSMGISSKEDQF